MLGSEANSSAPLNFRTIFNSNAFGGPIDTSKNKSPQLFSDAAKVCHCYKKGCNHRSRCVDSCKCELTDLCACVQPPGNRSILALIKLLKEDKIYQSFMLMSDTYSPEKFSRFLRYRGVRRVTMGGSNQASKPDCQVLTEHNEEISAITANSVSGTSIEEEEEPLIEFSRSSHGLVDVLHSLNSRRSQPHISRPILSSRNVLIHEEDDSNFVYYGDAIASDRRYSNNSERKLNEELRLYMESRAVVNNHHSWEQRDEITKLELSTDVRNEMGDEDLPTIESIANGGIYDPFHPGLSNLSSEDPMHLLEVQPAAKFRDLLQLVSAGTIVVNGVENSRKYKNNLSTVLQSTQGDFLILCCMSEILFYEFSPDTHLPEPSPVLRFETRPPFTSTADRITSTWPYYPHTINSLKKCDNWLHGAAIAVSCDDGSIYVWHEKTLVGQVQRSKSAIRLNSGFYGLRIAPDYSFKLEASAWGIDFATATDSNNRQHHVLVASSNSQNARLFYYHEPSAQFHSVSTQPLLHNIPEVSVVDYMVANDGRHHAIISCCSISGELAIISMSFKISRIEDESTNSIWPRKVGPMSFSEPIVLAQINLNTDCWTTKPIHSKYFKSVQSIRAMTGDHTIVDDEELAQVLTESKIFEEGPILKRSGTLGCASYWQYFESPVAHFERTLVNLGSINDTGKFYDLNEEYHMIHQAYKHQSNHGDVAPHPLKDILLAVSTESRLGLFRSDTLFCCAATRPVFSLDLPLNEETKWCNRISITHIIPELQCFIAATQLGLVTVMRLCEHKGLYGMRQEHIFPNAFSILVTESALRTLVGISVRDMSVSPAYPRFYLYVWFSDGLITTYRLESGQTSGPLFSGE